MSDHYRTGNHWKSTIIRVGTGSPDADGRRSDDELVGYIGDPELAEQVCALLNFQGDAVTQDRMRVLLHEIANTLNGAPGAHDWSDLAKLVTELREEVNQGRDLG